MTGLQTAPAMILSFAGVTEGLQALKSAGYRLACLTSNDAAAARAAGCPVVLGSYGDNHGEPASAVGADAVLDRLDELSAWLR